MRSIVASHRKFIVALLGAVLTVIVQFYSKSQLIQAVVPILSALGVYQLPNTTE